MRVFFGKEQFYHKLRIFKKKQSIELDFIQYFQNLRRGPILEGFYFAPSSDLDTMILQLSEVISKTNDKSNILIGGDFNVKPHSQEHEEICKYLESEGIYQALDSNKSTFSIQKDHPL